MQAYSLLLDSLIGRWRTAFEAAETALAAAGFDLPGGELRTRHGTLAAERQHVVETLGDLVRDRGTRPALLGLVTSRQSTKSLLGLRPDTTACVFNVDGVLVPSAAIHADAWRDLFNAFIARRVERTGGSFALFSRRLDYPTLIHGKPREAAVRDFLASRGIRLPEGTRDDPPDAETVHGLARGKSLALRRRIEQLGVTAYDGTRLYLELARDVGVRCAVVSGSTTTTTLLEHAGLAPWIDAYVDGRAAASQGLRRKPAPDMLLAACSRLGAEPEQTVAFEIGTDGVDAGRAGRFGLVVAVDHEGRGGTLREHGADLVVSDLGEVLERQLAS